MPECTERDLAILAAARAVDAQYYPGQQDLYQTLQAALSVLRHRIQDRDAESQKDGLAGVQNPEVRPGA